MVESLSRRLQAAVRSRHRLAIGESERPRSMAEADLVQQEVATLLGRRQTGWKAAATTRAAQAKRKLTGPVYGRTYRELTYADGDTIPLASLIDPYLEVEIAFRFGAALPAAGAPYSLRDVENSIESVIPAFEIVDARHDGWQNTDGPLLVADNVVHGATVLGRDVTDWRSIDLGTTVTALDIDGVEAATGRGDAVGCSPIEIVRWLVGRLAQHGHEVVPGHIVLSGMTSGLISLGEGRDVRASFGALGTLAVRFG